MERGFSDQTMFTLLSDDAGGRKYLCCCETSSEEHKKTTIQRANVPETQPDLRIISSSGVFVCKVSRRSDVVATKTALVSLTLFSQAMS